MRRLGHAEIDTGAGAADTLLPVECLPRRQQPPQLAARSCISRACSRTCQAIRRAAWPVIQPWDIRREPSEGPPTRTAIASRSWSIAAMSLIAGRLRFTPSFARRPCRPQSRGQRSRPGAGSHSARLLRKPAGDAAATSSKVAQAAVTSPLSRRAVAGVTARYLPGVTSASIDRGLKAPGSSTHSGPAVRRSRPPGAGRVRRACDSGVRLSVSDRSRFGSRSPWLWREFDVDAMVSLDGFDHRDIDELRIITWSSPSR
jgi:hypothetical protein